jgi:hypothetical protein
VEVDAQPERRDAHGAHVVPEPRPPASRRPPEVRDLADAAREEALALPAFAPAEQHRVGAGRQPQRHGAVADGRVGHDGVAPIHGEGGTLEVLPVEQPDGHGEDRAGARHQDDTGPFPDPRGKSHESVVHDQGPAQNADALQDRDDFSLVGITLGARHAHAHRSEFLAAPTRGLAYDSPQDPLDLGHPCGVQVRGARAHFGQDRAALVREETCGQWLGAWSEGPAPTENPPVLTARRQVRRD